MKNRRVAMQTRIFRVGKGCPKQGLRQAARILRNGGLVAFPTETVYGLGANAFDAKAVRQIFRVKGRPKANPLIVHVFSKRQIGQVAKNISPKAKKLIARFFPGPLSLVLEKSDKIPPELTGGLGTVCVRMPSMKLTRRFLSLCGVPVAAPSANLSGRPSPTCWRHVLEDLGGKIPAVIAGPPCTFGLESTVIDCSGRKLRLLRAGSLELEKIERLVGKVAVPRRLRKALSPGMRYRHYKPRAKVIVVDGAWQVGGSQASAYIGFDRPSSDIFRLRPKSKRQYARLLFSFFRSCDARGIKRIFCQRVSERGFGRAIMERLRKAAGK
ncbi:MAG: L-threonylcarbamoyladenylate synthase [Candidatus Micrarchaeota archaeon]|nr:L-threonylcarbamoyladenylate synthase [Candidatus Micrarchaeota archaeon]